MPMERDRYPRDWDDISRAARKRAGNKCQQCGVENGALILRSTINGEDYLILKDDGIYYDLSGSPVRMSEMPSGFDDVVKFTKIVLTVHHIGVTKPDGTPGDPHDKMDCRAENLIALCQKHHLQADMPMHIARRKETLHKRKHAQQLELF